VNKKIAMTAKSLRRVQGCALGLSLLLILATSLRAEDAPPEIVDNDHSPYHLALLAYKNDKFDAARTSIDAAEKAQPDDLAVKILKARILTEQHDYAGGEKLLQHLLSPAGDGPFEVQLALGDLYLRKRNFDGAARFYDIALQSKPTDPDLILKMIYARVSVSDFVTAAKDANKLKPFDPDNPAYYFAKAALAEATGKTGDAEQDIETVRTIYGITTTNRYLKTYLQVFPPEQASNAARAEPPKTNATPAAPSK